MCSLLRLFLRRKIAESVGVLPVHAHAARSGRAISADVQARHARLAAALALSELTQEKDIQGVVHKWGRQGFVSQGASTSTGCGLPLLGHS